MIVMHPLPRINEIRYDNVYRNNIVSNSVCVCLVSRLTKIPGLLTSGKQSLACMSEWHCSR